MAEDRGAAMAVRIEKAARRAGLEPPASHMAELFRTVLQRRAIVIVDPDDPDFLHPGRTLLILLEDLRILDPDILLAALLLDSERPELMLPGDEALATAGTRATAIADPIPTAHDHHRLETLVSLDADSLLVALAERLDHARHLHLRPAEAWAPFHRGIGAAELPAASRSHPRIAWRLQWWYDNFARRFLRAAR